MPQDGRILGHGKVLRNRIDGVDEHYHEKVSVNLHGPTIDRIYFYLPHVKILWGNNCRKTDPNISKEGTCSWMPISDMIMMIILIFIFTTKPTHV